MMWIIQFLILKGSLLVLLITIKVTVRFYLIVKMSQNLGMTSWCVLIFCRAISYMMSTLLYPVVTFVLLVVCVAYWGATALYPLLLCLHVCTCYSQATLWSVIYRWYLINAFSSFLKQMDADIWLLQEVPPTKLWLWTPPWTTVVVSMAPRTVTLWWAYWG